MKQEKMLLAMGLIDDRYVEEADPRRKKRKFNWHGFAAMAASYLLLITAVNMLLFFPYPSEIVDVSQYRDSEYYPLMQKLVKGRAKAPDYKNNFDYILSNVLFSLGINDDVKSLITGHDYIKPPTYMEVTDNQTEGVIEADQIKRSDRHIYYLDNTNQMLRIYEIAGTDSREVGSHPAQADEFYLSSDCATVTLIRHDRSITQLLALDVSDPTNIKEINKLTVTGDYLTSRLTNGKILLVHQKFFYPKRDEFSEFEEYLPKMDRGNGLEPIPISEFIIPEKCEYTCTVVVTVLDEKTMEIIDSKALYSRYAEAVYVSTDTVYLACYAYRINYRYRFIHSDSLFTDITGLSFSGDALKMLKTVRIEGSVKDQYSMDEYNGVLRVVTTTSDSVSKRQNAEIQYYDQVSEDTNASLYCIDVSSMKIIGKVEKFAPEGEEVKSVRFDGDKVYVCTAVTQTLQDPVFFFDLSDPKHITSKDTGTIFGFSSSLIQLENGYLLGIGVGEERTTVKVEVYEETETGVASVCKFEIKNAFYTDNYKSYYVDRKNNLFGFGIIKDESTEEYSTETPYYYLLCFEDRTLKTELKVEFDNTMDGTSNIRAVLIDDCFYLFCNSVLRVIPYEP